MRIPVLDELTVNLEPNTIEMREGGAIPLK